ncbi:MAG: hypothetical protein NTV94_03480 [Planctomycetota bacterium]|nr:hypothetical protein [Planctomycetota bacterium]
MINADPDQFAGLGVPEYAIAVQQLAAALVIARGGMSFIFAVCNSVPLRQRILAELGPRVPGALTVELTGSENDAFDAALAAAGETRPPAIFITGLDFPLRDDETGSAALTAFNASRELWWSRFSCPVVFFLSEAALLRVMRGAPDMWSRKSHVFEFVQPPEALLPVISRPQSMLDDDIARWPVARREARLLELRARVDPIPNDASSHERQHRVRWRNESGHIHLAMQRRAEALTCFDAASKEAEAIGDLASLSANAIWASHVRIEDGDLDGAERRIDAALRIVEPRHKLEDGIFAPLLCQRARIRLQRGLLDEAEGDIGRSIAVCEAQIPRDGRSLAVCYALLASISQSRSRLAEADEYISKSIALNESSVPHDDRAVAIWYATRARIRRDLGLLSEADEDISRSINWAQAQVPRDERALAFWYASRSRIRHDRGLPNEADEDISRSINWAQAQGSRDERALAIFCASRASIRMVRGYLQLAYDDISRSIAWGEAQVPRDERLLAIWSASRASIREECGDPQGAEEDLNRAIVWFEAHNPLNESGLQFLYESKALLLARKKQFDEAQRAIDESVRLHIVLFGADHEWTKTAIARQQAIHAGKVPG